MRAGDEHFADDVWIVGYGRRWAWATGIGLLSVGSCEPD
jgi:hypothetical protein